MKPLLKVVYRNPIYSEKWRILGDIVYLFLKKFNSNITDWTAIEIKTRKKSTLFCSKKMKGQFQKVYN